MIRLLLTSTCFGVTIDLDQAYTHQQVSPLIRAQLYHFAHVQPANPKTSYDVIPPRLYLAQKEVRDLKLWALDGTCLTNPSRSKLLSKRYCSGRSEYELPVFTIQPELLYRMRTLYGMPMWWKWLFQGAIYKYLMKPPDRKALASVNRFTFSVVRRRPLCVNAQIPFVPFLFPEQYPPRPAFIKPPSGKNREQRRREKDIEAHRKSEAKLKWRMQWGSGGWMIILNSDVVKTYAEVAPEIRAAAIRLDEYHLTKSVRFESFYKPTSLTVPPSASSSFSSSSSSSAYVPPAHPRPVITLPPLKWKSSAQRKLMSYRSNINDPWRMPDSARVRYVDKREAPWTKYRISAKSCIVPSWFWFFSAGATNECFVVSTRYRSHMRCAPRLCPSRSSGNCFPILQPVRCRRTSSA